MARWLMFFEFLGNPEGLKERVVDEVVEQLDNTIKAVQDKAIAWQRHREAGKQAEPAPPPEQLPERLKRSDSGS